MEPIPSSSDPVDEQAGQASDFGSSQRLDAQRRRSQADELFQKSTAVWEEAVRCGEAGRNALDAGGKPVGNTISRRIRAIKKGSEASEASYRKLQDKALAAKDKSNDAVSVANSLAEQELADAGDVLAAAEAALGAAMEDLKTAQAIWAQLGELNPAPTEPDEADEAGTSAAAAFQEETAIEDSMSATEALRQEIARAREPGDGLDSPSPAEDARSELEFLKGVPSESSAVNPIVTNKDTGPVLEHPLADISVESVAPSDEPYRAVSSKKPAPPPTPASEAIAAAYAGRVYLMFDANLTQQDLEAIWDAIEESSEVGAIVDTRLVSKEEGVQMTLDLRAARLDISAVQARLPGVVFSPIAADRLRVTWLV